MHSTRAPYLYICRDLKKCICSGRIFFVNRMFFNRAEQMIKTSPGRLKYRVFMLSGQQNFLRPFSSTGPAIQKQYDQLILVDSQDKEIGTFPKYDCHLLSNDTPLHRAFSVFLFDQHGKMLIQRRSAFKPLFSKYWSNTCCSHPTYNDVERGIIFSPPNTIQGAQIAASQRIEFELGLKINSDELKYMGKMLYKAKYDEIYGEHEMDYIFLCQIPNNEETTMKHSELFNKEEVEEIQWVSKEEWREMVKRKECFTPWFNYIAQNHLSKWWEQVEETGSVAKISPFHENGIMDMKH